MGVAKDSSTRAVVFAERVDTLHWLQQRLRKEFGMAEDQVTVLHGGLTDVDQQEVVESFKQAGSPIRVLVTGDVASEGVNLHKQCHELIHYDIPWSLIRLEQRNGRIDRYGQKVSPQITTLLLQPSSQTFSGDLVVLTKLLEREEQAHKALGDAASLMGKYSVEAEEEEILKVLAGQQDLDEVVADVATVASGGGLAGLLARLSKAPAQPTASAANHPRTLLYTKQVDFLRDALQEAFRTPAARPQANGVGWKEYPQDRIAEFAPPADLRQRLEVLPATYLSDRKVLEDFKLVTTPTRGQEVLAEALVDTSSHTSWPEAHYLGPLHPVLDWAADQALASLSRNEVFALRGTVDVPTVLLLGTLTNRRGQVVAASFMAVEFYDPDSPHGFVTPYGTPQEMLEAVGLTGSASNPGAPAGIDKLQALMPAAVRDGDAYLEQVFVAAADSTQQRVDDWVQRTDAWMDAYESDVLIKRSEVKQRRIGVAEEKKLLASMAPDRQLLRPLAMILPADHPVAAPPAAPMATGPTLFTGSEA
nr:helicase-related protein [Raineyella fluvialis]